MTRNPASEQKAHVVYAPPDRPKRLDDDLWIVAFADRAVVLAARELLPRDA